MQPKVSKGLATWAGIVAAAGQYAAAVAVFLDDPDKATALGPLTTATATLAVVIYGRMGQAKTLALFTDHAERDEALGVAHEWDKAYAGSKPRPHAGGDFAVPDLSMFDPVPEPAEGDTTGCQAGDD